MRFRVCLGGRPQTQEPSKTHMPSRATDTRTNPAYTTQPPRLPSLIPFPFKDPRTNTNPPSPPHSSTIFSPLNLTIVLALFGLLYLRYRSSQTSSVPHLDPSRPITFATFTPRSLLKYNGHPNPINPQGSVYIAVKGKVHDVTAGRNFYGPGGPYENFAGRDATRGLACQSFDEDMLTKNLDGPLDPCDDLDADQLENLQGWVERFDDKVCGFCVRKSSSGEYEAGNECVRPFRFLWRPGDWCCSREAGG